MKLLFKVIISLFSVATANAQESIRFTNPDSLLAFAEQQSIALKTGDAQILLAKYQTLYAKINRFNPRASANYAATNNSQLPVNFFPAEIFNGKPGTFKEVYTGKQYVQSVYLTPQIDVINPVAWAELKSAKLGGQLTTINNTLTKKTLFESLAASYFNIVSFQQQITITSKTLLNADSILKIFTNKYEQGIIRSQDVSNAKVNHLLVKNRLQLLQTATEQQFNILKLLCDTDPTVTFIIEHQDNAAVLIQDAVVSENILYARQAQTQLQYSISEYKAGKAAHFPTLSFIGYWAKQQNSNLQFFDNTARWIPANYIGLRLSYTFPDAGRLYKTATAKANWKTAEMNLKHKEIQQKMEYLQLLIDYKKAKESMIITKEIRYLKEDIYRKNLNLFLQDIYPADNLLSSFTDALTASLDYQSALINLQYQQSKISINNSIQ
ncbi:MAG: TolC family protein [Cyclobacteriaceae bacterium]